MGFLNSETGSIELTAKLTPYGRQQLLQNSSSIITQFSLGDSDANYNVDEKLVNGFVPSMTGGKGPYESFNNGLYSGFNIKTPIEVDATGTTKKLVQFGSNTVTITPVTNADYGTAISGYSMTHLKIDRTNLSSIDSPNGESNLFQSFGLPISQAQKELYTTTPSPNGYFDTAIEDINQDNVLVLEIPNCDYGELVDGKVIKLDIVTSATTYTIYSTFQKSLTNDTAMDIKLVENQSLGVPFGANVALLFSDDIQGPNTGSWSDGFAMSKPFSLNGKQQFNSVTNASTGVVKDKAVGIAYLSKGIIVITNQEIVDAFTIGTDEDTTMLYINSISNEVAQNITCIVERDEFATSNNPTHTDGELIRVSEVGLYDSLNNLIAVAKSSEQVLIGANQFMALGVKILV